MKDETTITLSERKSEQGPAGSFTAGDQATLWQADEGWYFCYHGVSSDGNAYESDDVGPFPTRKAATRYACRNAAGENRYQDTRTYSDFTTLEELAMAVAADSARGEWYNGPSSTNILEWIEEGTIHQDDEVRDLAREWDE